MRAVHVTRLDGPDALELVEVPAPSAGPGQVLVDVHVAGIAYPDVLLSRGEYQMKPPVPFGLGAECAGVVAESAAAFEKGARVAGFPVFGAFAEQVAVDASLLFAIPDNLSFEAAAALPMNYLTVEFALVQRARLLPGETVLVHGAAGGIGTAAIQLAKVMGARVIACTSTAEKGKVARDLGADDVVLVADLREGVKELTGGKGVDLVVDPVGGDRFTDSLRSLAVEGRLLVIGFTGGEIPQVKVNRLLLNNISVVGVGWGAYFSTRPGYLQEQWARLLPHLESGAIDPPIGARFPLADAAEAVRELDERRALGKVVLTVR